MEWINFAFCMVVNYNQMVTLFEVNQNKLNYSGWVVNIISFIFLVITLGCPSLICLKNLVVFIKRTHFNVKNKRQK